MGRPAWSWRAKSAMSSGVRSLVFCLALAACGKADECRVIGGQCAENRAENCRSQADNELSGHLSLSREACGARTCVIAASGVALCAEQAAPDPDCPPALRDRSEAQGCQAGALLRWSYGFRVETTSCAMGARCADVSASGFDPACAGQAFCSPLAGVDPICQGRATPACLDATTIVHCACNYRVEAHACASPGPRCELVAVGADAGLLSGACRP